MSSFSKKFGDELFSSIPSDPGIYMFSDADGVVIYVGKSRNLKRRLAAYRKESRRKRYAKMRKIVKSATALTWEVSASEEAALLREDELIKKLKPHWNMAGAFFATYPAIGVRSLGGQNLEICLGVASAVSAFQDCQFTVYGTFRDRGLTSEAFHALSVLFGFIGHAETKLKKRYKGLPRGTSLAAFRRIDAHLQLLLTEFLSGRSSDFLSHVATDLLDRISARNNAAQVEDSLKALRLFFCEEPRKLADAWSQGLIPAQFVSCEERDQLTIRMMYSR